MLNSSGPISLRGIAQEKANFFVDVTDPNGQIGLPTWDMPHIKISLLDMVYGGNGWGSGISFDETNTYSPVHPNEESPHSLREWLGYEHKYPKPAPIGHSVQLYMSTVGYQEACSLNMGGVFTVIIDAPTLSTATSILGGGDAGYYADFTEGIVRYYPGDDLLGNPGVFGVVNLCF